MRKILLSLFIALLSLPLMAQNKAKVYNGISYVSATDTSAYRREQCKLDIYLPAQAKGFKTLVWFHGGGLTGGKRTDFPHELLGSNYCVVTPSYRLYPRAKNPSYTEDAAAAVAWVFKHIAEYGGDPTQIYVAGHSAGGYLTLMLALDKRYLGLHGIDADAVKGYFPVGGQCATHYTIRKERGISFTTPIADRFAPLNNVRKLQTRLVLITGDRHLEQMCRYEENAYLKAAMEGIGNSEIPLYELQGFDHGASATPAALLIKKLMNEKK